MMSIAAVAISAQSSAVLARSVDLPLPSTHVADHAGVMDPRVRAELDGWLTELEQKTAAQVIVLTVRTLGGMPIEQFCLEIAERWQLGKKGKDNGVLICVAVEDRKYRFEIGYGLEGALPDSWCGTVGREYLRPYFRRGDFGGGLREATIAVVRKIAAEYGVEVSGVPAPRRNVEDEVAWQTVVVVLAILLIVFVLVARGSYLAVRRVSTRGGVSPEWLAAMIASEILSSRRSRRSWGGWSAGSWGGGLGDGGSWGGGSFGGGGGGSFGGGGASGGW